MHGIGSSLTKSVKSSMCIEVDSVGLECEPNAPRRVQFPVPPPVVAMNPGPGSLIPPHQPISYPCDDVRSEDLIVEYVSAEISNSGEHGSDVDPE
jgi:hypothetical protein